MKVKWDKIKWSLEKLRQVEKQINKELTKVFEIVYSFRSNIGL